MGIIGRVIELTEEEVERCREFAIKCAENQQAIEFGQKDTEARTKTEVARDNLIGKIAEVAFKKMIETNYAIPVDLDFNYYPRGIWDNEDTAINGWRIDVKGIREGGKWLLVEWSKLAFRMKENKLPHYFVAFSVGWDRKNDEPTGIAAFKGFVPLSKLDESVKETEILRKGNLLPGTKTVLQADNFGIMFDNLDKKLTKTIEYIIKNSPPDFLTESFHLPKRIDNTMSIIDF